MAGVNDNLIPPKKGEVRNPKGYPKGVPHSKTRLKRLLLLTENLTNPITQEVEGFTVAEQLDLAQIIKARKGDTKAYTAIMDRLEGKPNQSVDMNVQDKVEATTEQKIKDFLNDTNDGAYDEGSTQPIATDEPDSDPEVAQAPTDIS